MLRRLKCDVLEWESLRGGKRDVKLRRQVNRYIAASCKTPYTKRASMTDRGTGRKITLLTTRPVRRDRPSLIRSTGQTIETTYDVRGDTFQCQTNEGIQWVNMDDIDWEPCMVGCVYAHHERDDLVSVFWDEKNRRACVLPRIWLFDAEITPHDFKCKRVLDEHGVVILKGAINKSLCKKIRKHANRTYFNANLVQNRYRVGRVPIQKIFNTESSWNTARRLQAELTGDEKRLQKNQAWTKSRAPKLYDTLNVAVANVVHRHISPTLHPKQSVILHSEKHQVRQYAHRDYNRHYCKFQRGVTDTPSLRSNFGIIVALQKGTRFVCWPGSHNCDVEEVNADDVVCPTLSTGDMVIFMDTTVHAGASYSKSNTRIHYYCDDVVRAEKCRDQEGSCTFPCITYPPTTKKYCLLRNPNYTDDTVRERISPTVTFSRSDADKSRGAKDTRRKYNEWLRNWTFGVYADKNSEQVRAIEV